MKKRMNKKGLSLMISYILLITFAIVISTVVYRQIENYAKLKNPINCPDGVSFFVYDVDCDMDGSNLTFKIRNDGRFDIAGYFIHATNNSNQELATIDLSPNLISGGSNLTKAILFSQTGENVLEPNNEKISMFRLDNKIYSIDIVPVRYQKVDNRMRFVQCGGARIKESVSCVTFDPLNMSGLVSWWKFEGNVDDETNNNNDGTNSGVSFRQGKSGSSAYFDGSSYITVPDSSSLDITENISIAIWINATSGGPNAPDTILDKSTGNDGYTFDISRGGGGGCSGNDVLRLGYGSGNLCSQTTIQRNQWQYVVATYNKTDALFYINGMFNSSLTQSELNSVNTEQLLIGKDSQDNAKYFEGQLDELMIFNRVINSTEIAQLYDYFT